MKPLLFAAAAATALVPFGPAMAQTAAESGGNSSEPAGARTKPPSGQSSSIVITGRRLDAARDSITPSLGASQYTFNQEALNKQPGGTNLTLNK